MGVNALQLNSLKEELLPYGATLVAVSKTKPLADIEEAIQLKQFDFGENYVQELLEKNEQISTKVNWHFIGHLQSNKAKQVVPVATLIHGVDSFSLLNEINKQASKNGVTAHCLLQIFIANETTKFGLSFDECDQLLNNKQLAELKNISICGFMGMATNTENINQISHEFRSLRQFFEKHISSFSLSNKLAPVLSMGMSADYKIALQEGSTLIRIGSAIFGSR